MILALDPGTTESAYVLYDGGDVHAFGMKPNEDLPGYLRSLRSNEARLLAVEMVASYGMPVGKEVFETVLWIGRFIEAWGRPYVKVYRKDVKLHLCGSLRAKDANVRRAILDKYPRTGGGATPQIGTKASPGPLYGMSGHAWSALAVAITADETNLKTAA